MNNSLVSYFLEPDYATYKPWEFNNDQFKPEGGVFSKNYRYVKSNPLGERLYKFRLEQEVALDQFGNPILDENGNPVQVSAQVPDYYLSNPCEAMSHACSTWGKALGAQFQARDAIINQVDLSNANFRLSGEDDPGFGDEHSDQFNASIRNLKDFYDGFLTRLLIDPAP